MGYGQYCGCARALDIVGDRWTLLIVRELLVSPARFTDLRAGLPGIATNLLSNRLKALQADGVVERRLASTGVVYALTEWGAQLREPLMALVRWSGPLMARGPAGDEFRPQWLVVPLEGFLAGRTVDRPTRVALHVDGATIGLDGGPDGVSVELDAAGPFDAELSATGQAVLALVAGARSLDQVLAGGAVLIGNRPRLEAVIPYGDPRTGASASSSVGESGSTSSS